jgi:hypothetical protein
MRHAWGFVGGGIEKMPRRLLSARASGYQEAPIREKPKKAW